MNCIHHFVAREKVSKKKARFVCKLCGKSSIGARQKKKRAAEREGGD